MKEAKLQDSPVVYLFANGLFYPSNEQYKEIPNDAIEVREDEFMKAMNRKPGETFDVSLSGDVIIHEVPQITIEQ